MKRYNKILKSQRRPINTDFTVYLLKGILKTIERNETRMWDKNVRQEWETRMSEDRMWIKEPSPKRRNEEKYTKYFIHSKHTKGFQQLIQSETGEAW